MSSAAAAPRRGRRRHRRVDAPPTNPEADRTDDAPGQDTGRMRDRRPANGSTPLSGDPREVWIEQQRPPHWE